MPEPPTHAAALSEIQRALAAELGCAPADFSRDGVRVFRRPADGGDPGLRRRFPVWAESFSLVSFGPGAVAAASPALVERARELFADAPLDEAFAPDRLGAISDALAPYALRCFGPVPRLLVGSELLRRRPPPAGVRLTVDENPDEESLDALGKDGAWPNAIRPRPLRPTAALALARDGERVVGMATLQVDAPRLWQVGLDVAEAARGRGIGAALTAELSALAHARGAHPCYSAAAWNVPSLRTALAVGYRPAFHEVFTYAAAPEGARELRA